MKNNKLLMGIVITALLAASLSQVQSQEQHSQERGKCFDLKTCKDTNACGGQGWLYMSMDACMKAGGTFEHEGSGGGHSNGEHSGGGHSDGGHSGGHMH